MFPGSISSDTTRPASPTLAASAFQFKQPVFMGDLLSFYAEVIKVGNTSLTVKVEVYAQRTPADVEVVKVTEATLTYVATGEDRRPRTVPPPLAK